MDQGAMDSVENQEEDFAALLEESFKKQDRSTRLADGVIVEINEAENRALVDVGEKSEGILNLDEIKDSEGNLTHNNGDKLKVMITGYYNERPKISYLKVLEQEKTQNFIEANKDNFEDLIVTGTVTKKNRGGFVVESDGVNFFMPRSLAAFKDDNSVIGREVQARVLKIDEEDGSIVISRRKYLNEERKRKKQIVDSLMEEDKIISGIVKKITSYGMFVDVGGVDGLVHYNEISYKGPVNPSKYYKEGDTVDVKAISYDKDKRHLSLSIKAVTPDPWVEVEEELDEGDTITVTVSNIEPYGAFVDLGNDIEGFLHISEITWDKNIKDPNKYLEVGKEIDVEVIEINSKKHKLRVSLKKLQPRPFEEFIKNFKEGDVVTGKVTSLTDFGAFVQIGGVEGLLHNQDGSWDKSKKCKDFLKNGDEVEVKIVKINKESEKISLNKKVLEESPSQKFAKEHSIGDTVTGTVRDVKDFGVFISLDDGVDALIRLEDLGPLKAEELEKGQSIEAAISMLDSQKDRIRLSVKRMEKLKEQAMLNEYNKDDDSNSLGDLIKEKLK